MELHYLQEQILKKLIGSAQGNSYGELRIRNVENDLFNYHLQKLVKLNLIEKNLDKYSLSFAGKKLTEGVLPLGVIRPKADLFKLYSHGIVIRKDTPDLQIINRVRTKQPFYGDKGILGESVRKGVDSKTALQQRLKSQVGVWVELEDMIHGGTVRKINKLANGEIFSDFIFNFYFCLDYLGDLDPTLDSGNVFWAPIAEAIANERSSKTPIHYLIKILMDLKSDPQLVNFAPSYSEEELTITTT